MAERSRKQMARVRRRRRRILQRVIPVAVALVLIAVLFAIALKTGVFESFSYSNDKADLYSYFGSTSDNSAVVVKNNSISADRIKLVNGIPYMNFDIIKSDYVPRFYHDEDRSEILYTNANETIRTKIGSSSYGPTGTENSLGYPVTIADKDRILMALDYAGMYGTLSYNLCGGNGEPYRIEIMSSPVSVRRADVIDDKAIRIKADRKSDILVTPGEGMSVRVLDLPEGGSVEGWTMVETEDLIIGYIESKCLGNIRDESLNVATVPEITVDSLTKDTPVVIAWSHISGEAGHATALESIKPEYGLTVVSPTWFAISDNDGNVASIASHDYVDKVHSMGIEVWGMVDNFTYDMNTYKILKDEDKRKALIERIISYANEYSLDGINIDFESLTEECGEPFIQFIRELSIQTRANDLILSIDNYVPKEHTAFYNRREQGVFADYVIIMGYDEHYSGSEEAGSVASIGYVKYGIEATIAEVPENKVINALPFYTRLWKTSPKTEEELAYIPDNETETIIDYNINEVKALRMQEGINTVAEHKAETVWDESTGQNYAEWSNENFTYRIWLEDAASLELKLKAMTEHKLGGVAVWQLAFSEDFAWELIGRYY